MRVLVCYHKSDLDGKCSAAVVGRHYNWNVDFLGSDYNYQPPISKIASLKGGDKFYLLDLSFKPDQMRRIKRLSEANGFRFIYIDHHISACRLYSDLGLDGLLETSAAACELTYRFFYPNKPIPIAVKLLSDYDTWQIGKSNWRSEILPFQFGMRVFNTNPGETILWSSLLDIEKGSHLWKLILNRGDAIVRYLEKTWAGLQAQCCDMHLGVIPCKVLSGKFNSMAFGNLVEETLCVCLELCSNRLWKIHLYSKIYDVSKIAQRYGGGGHKGAAGFVCKNPFKYLKTKPSIYEKVKNWVIERVLKNEKDYCLP